MGRSRLLTSVVASLVTTVSFAVVPPEDSSLRRLEFRHPDLDYRNIYRPLAELPVDQARRLGAELSRLGVDPGNAYFDRLTGRWGTVVATQPLIPGPGVGNSLQWSDLGFQEPPSGGALGEAAAQAFTDYLALHAAELRIDPAELTTPRVRVFGERVIQLHVGRQIDGIPVRGAFVSATINSGNLVLLGARRWGEPTLETQPSLTGVTAEASLAEHLEGFVPSGFRKEPRLEILPVASWGISLREPEAGLRHRLAWVLTPEFADDTGGWEALVDAHSGELLAFQDTNHYASRRVEGWIYPVSNDGNPPDGELVPGFPMPFADLALDGEPLGFTSAGGNVPPGADTGTISTALSGRYLHMNDECGVIDESAATGDLDLEGVPGGTDCEVPPGHSPGDTNATRSGFYELNRIIEQGRGYLPDNGWLNGQLTANMNLNQTCNAFWNGSVNFFRSGGGCSNTGELAGVFDHEWGHGMDNNDATGSISNPGEGIADIFSANRLNTSCMGRNFRPGVVCGGYGDPCTECTGVRDIDWEKRQSGQPHDVAWIDANCGSGGGTPCGGSTHCEGAVYAEAVWDFVHRDLMDGAPFDLDLNTALELGTRLTYSGSSNVGNWFQCVTDGTGGCNADGGYLNYLAVDDDNGDLTDGTPHMTAIFAAFDRHQIACPTPTAQNSGCAGGPTTAPANVVATPINEGAHLTWDAVAGASEYWIYRTEGVHGCDFGKTLVGKTTSTEFVEFGLRNGFEVLYGVVAVGDNDACTGPMSACQAVSPVEGPGLGFDPSTPEWAGQTGDGDGFFDNCETGTLTFQVSNTGTGALTDVRIVDASITSHPEAEILTDLPATIAANLPEGESAAAELLVLGGGFAFNDTLTLEVTVTSDELDPLAIPHTYSLAALESDLQAESTLTFSFEAGEDGWQLDSGIFDRTDAPPGGANGTDFYRASSDGLDQQCDRIRSPLVELTETSTLELYNQFDIEPFSGGFWWDRANVGVFDPLTGERTIVSPDGGRTYNASGSNPAPAPCASHVPPEAEGWAGAGPDWQASTWTPGALGSPDLAGQLVQLDVAYGTDPAATGDIGFWFDEVTLTDVNVQVPDSQPDVCAGAPVLSFDPSSLDFGDVDVGTTSPPQSAMLHNTGDTDATGVTFSGLPDAGFEADTSACGDTLPAGGSCAVSVTFTPAVPGPVTATLHVDSDEGAGADLGLSGNGVGDGTGPIADISPDAFDFTVPVGGNSTQVLNVGNIGDEDLTWSIDEAESGLLPVIVPEGAPYRYDLAEMPEFHAPVGSDRASGISRSRGEAPADRVVLPAPQAQAVGSFTEGFDDITTLPGAGWAMINNSEPQGPSSWFQGNETIFPSHEGAPDAYIAANFESTDDAGDISNWLLTPEVTIVNGTTACFWTRTSEQFEEFYDRLEVRMSIAGDSTDVGDTAESVGDFTDLLLSINPDLLPDVYPEEWTEFCVTVRERSREPVTGRFAFRYWVTDSGPDGTNGDYIGIDTVSVTQPEDGGGCASPTDIPWLSATPDTGTTAPGEIETSDVTVDATDLEVGDELDAQLCVSTNDPNAPLVEVPVHVTVTEGGDPPVIDVDPDSLESTLPEGGMETQPLTISNLGDETLDWQVTETPSLATGDRASSAVGRAAGRGAGLAQRGRGADGTARSWTDPRQTFAAPDRTVRNDFVGLGSLTFYDDRGDFQAANPGLPLEDFTDTDVPPNQVVTCPTPFNSDTDNDCFSPGDIEPGLSMDVTVGSGGGLGVVLTPPFAGVPCVSVGPNSFGDHADWDFDPPVRAAGFDLQSNAPGQVFTVTVFGPGGELGFTDVTTAGLGAPVFLGIDTADTDGISRLEVRGTGDLGELFCDVEFGGGLGGPDCTLPAWVSVDPTSGSVPGGGSQVADVTFDATGLDVGTHTANLCLESNDPVTPLVMVPLTLTVEGDGVPTADISPDSFTFEVPEGGSGAGTLNLGNIGTGDLVWDIHEAEDAAQQAPQGNLGDIVVFDDINFTVPVDFEGGSVQWSTGETCECDKAPFDFNMWGSGAGEDILAFFWPAIDGVQGGGVSLDGGSTYAVLEPGATIGPDSEFIASTLESAAANWRQPDGVDSYLGFEFVNPDTGETNFGYVRITTTGTTGHPATIVGWAYNQVGDPITIPADGGGCDAPTDVPWLSANPTSGTTAPGSSEPVDVAVDASGLDPGDYSALLCVNTNDPEAPQVEIPVDLTVIPGGDPPVIDVDPDSLESTLPEGGMETHDLTISNLGVNALTWEVTESPAAGQGLRSVARPAGPTPDELSAAAGGDSSKLRSAGGRGVDSTAPSWTDPGQTFAAPDPTVRNDFVSLGSLTFYDDRGDFQAANPGLPLEDFADTDVPPNQVVTCPTPFNSDTDNDCFSPGDIEPGLSMDVTVGSGGGLGVVLTPPFAGVPCVSVGPNSFGDHADWDFDPPVRAVGFDLQSSAPGQVFTVTAFGPGGELGSTDVTAAGVGASVFLGIDTADTDGISRLEVRGTGDLGELFCDVEFGGGLGGPDCTLPAWVSVDPTSGSVPGGGSQVADVTFDATGLDEGTHTANLCLTSNDPATPLVVVPLTLTVTPGEELACFAAELDGDQETPPVPTDHAGTGAFTYDFDTQELTWEISHDIDLTEVIGAHIHVAPIGEPGPIDIILDHTMNPIIGSATLTPEQEGNLTGELYYVNIHTNDFSGGEIRGQILPCEPEPGDGSLTTLFASNNGFAGNTFDLEPVVALDITGFDVNVVSDIDQTITVYWKEGTAEGFDSDPTAWTVLGSDTVTPAGQDQPTHVELGGLTLEPGNVYGFYVDLESYALGVSVLRYTDGPPTVFANDELSLKTLVGKATPAFEGTTFADRMWNGTVHYSFQQAQQVETGSVRLPTR